jgi:hypothetical protein
MRAIRLLLCFLVFASGGALGTPSLAVLVSGLSDNVVVGSDLRPGASVSRHGLTLEVPGPGYGVWAEALLDGGGAVELSVQTGRDGKVTVRESSITPGSAAQGDGDDQPV